MSGNALTRRSFLAGTAGAIGAVGLTGCSGLGAWGQADADNAAASGQISMVHSTCNACANECGFTAYVLGGKLQKLIGDANNPKCKGHLCARGYAYAQIAYSEDRLTDPLKKNDNGEFETISWGQALEEIGGAVQDIVAADGPSSLAAVAAGGPSGEYYAKRFMNALGSSNVYTDSAARYGSRESGINQVIGATSWESDAANSKMTLFIGQSYAEEALPARIAEMQDAHEAGAHLVLVDPRFTSSQKLADEWVPIKPGTELAFVLALCSIVIRDGSYDKDFVAENGVGFDQFAQDVAQYTASWASDITGVEAGTIDRLAKAMAAASPACSIDLGMVGGSAYENSGELARTCAVFNALIGCYNQQGGALLVPKVEPGELDETAFPPVPEPDASMTGADEFPLAVQGSVLAALQAAHDRDIKGLFFYNSNPVGGYANPSYLQEAVEGCELSVCIDVQMSETAQACQYVLPDTSYLERSELPRFQSGRVPSASMRTQVIDKVLDDTKPVDEIFSELAQACGVGDYFDFTMDDLAEAQLVSVGSSTDAARREGTVSFGTQAFSYGSTPEWNTPTGKVQFASDACAEAGLSATPEWVSPDAWPTGGELRLITSYQPIRSGATTNNETLMNITEKYDLTRAWVNTNVAEQLGISEGDTIQIGNGNATGRIAVHVTNRIVEGALYLPAGYGVTAKEQTRACGVGLNPADFVPFHIEPAYGSAMANEACVTIKKVG